MIVCGVNHKGAVSLHIIISAVLWCNKRNLGSDLAVKDEGKIMLEAKHFPKESVLYPVKHVNICLNIYSEIMLSDFALVTSEF